jgi:hypothetical protein
VIPAAVVACSVTTASPDTVCVTPLTAPSTGVTPTGPDVAERSISSRAAAESRRTSSTVDSWRKSTLDGRGGVRAAIPAVRDTENTPGAWRNTGPSKRPGVSPVKPVQCGAGGSPVSHRCLPSVRILSSLYALPRASFRLNAYRFHSSNSSALQSPLRSLRSSHVPHAAL